MSNEKLTISEQCGVAGALWSQRELIQSTWFDDNLCRGVYLTKEVEAKVDIFRSCRGLVRNADASKGEHAFFYLFDDFRKVLESVLGERVITALTEEDCGNIAERYTEWLPLPLNGWDQAIYNSHSVR
jgi:hypothetical protein